MKKLTRIFTPRRLKAIFYLNLLIIIALVGYRGYLIFFERDFQGVHAAQIQRIKSRLEDRQRFEFTVVGNINNSVGLFERRMIPRIHSQNPEFLISAGNAVSSGGEDKYRALYDTLGQLEIPYVLTVGDNESSVFGSFYFYDHFGPYFHAFRAGNSEFIFLDTSNESSWPYQLVWLEELLSRPSPGQRFVFTGYPLLPPETPPAIDLMEAELPETAFAERLREMFRRHDVSAVFASDMNIFDHQRRDGIHYIITGGAGGLVLNDENSYHHFVRVRVDGGELAIDAIEMDSGQGRLLQTLESLWFMVHSLFYVGHLNFLLVVSALVVLAIKLYTSVFRERDYYPDFDLDPAPWLGRRLNIAMLSNNYLPFIGGVPISIDRLRRGLQELGHRVLIIAPRYGRQTASDESGGVLRIPSLAMLGSGREFRVANIFSPRIGQALRHFRPDLVHVHHPFWLGRAGLWRARRLKVPVVYTYHTRLEHYAHYVPLPGLLFRNLISHGLVRRFANQCDGVVVPTESAEEYLRLIGVSTPIFVQATGIDFQRFQQHSQDDQQRLREQWELNGRRVLISVSRLSKEKNIYFIIDALRELRTQTEEDFLCLMIGEGEEEEALQQYIEALGMQEHIRLVGGVAPEEMLHYYHLGDAFLFASKSETQGMVILEAMAARLPVVAVRSSGIEDVVRDQFNGFKTPEDRHQWAARLRSLLEDEILRDRMASRAREFARDYAIDRYAENMHEIYARVLAAHHKNRQPL